MSGGGAATARPGDTGDAETDRPGRGDELSDGGVARTGAGQAWVRRGDGARFFDGAELPEEDRPLEDGRRLAVYAPSDQVLRVLSMTGLTANGLVFDSAEEALAALGDPS